MPTSKCILLAIVLFIYTFEAAAESRRLQGKGFTTKLTTSAYTQTDPQVSVIVTFPGCVEGVTVDDFLISTSSANVRLDEQIKSLQYLLIFNLPDYETAEDVKVTLKAGSVNLAGSSTSNNEASVNFRYERSDFSTTVKSLSVVDYLASWQVDFGRPCGLSVTKNGQKDFPLASKLTLESDSGSARLYTLEYTAAAGQAGSRLFVSSFSSSLDDVVSLTVEEGMCSNNRWVNRKSSTTESYINKGAVGCTKWSAWSACSEACLSYDQYFRPIQGYKFRSRASLIGQTCSGSTVERRTCNSQPCDAGSRPRSGETGAECLGCRSDAYTEFNAPSGCVCKRGCVANGDCCQDWFRRGCAGKASRNRPEFAKDANGVSWKPYVCTKGDCNSMEPKFLDNFASYWCYCHANCGPAADGSKPDECCSGFNSVVQQCSR